MQLKINKEMEFKTLKKCYKKQIIIGAIAICIIGGALTFSLTKAKYQVEGEVDLAKGTVNYKAYDFKIMAMYQSEDGSNYTEITDRMPSSGYVINEEKSYCTIDNKTHDTNVRLYTNNSGEHVFSNLTKSDKCYLYFDKQKLGADQILANVTIEEGTPTFSSTATTDEGVYSVSDEMYGGTSYYWRGAVTNNYVRFANFCWRIIRINGDKSIRLIYDGNICHNNGESTADNIAISNQSYNVDRDKSEYVGWTYEVGKQRPTNNATATESSIKKKTEKWYSETITETNANKVTDGKFCNDRNTASEYSWNSNPSSTFYYAGYERLYTNKTPTLSCSSGDVYLLSVGLITADEVSFAGGVYGLTNNLYYLYNGQSYWTMSSSSWDGTYTAMLDVRNNGHLGNNWVSWTAYGIRPVINLRSDVTFSGGDGTLDNPYVVAN